MPPMTGRHIAQGMMGPGFRNLFGLGLGAELLYSFVIIVCSLMIYIGTKELYELSSHKGIKYFRMSFLFFALAYFVRSFIKFALRYFEINGILELSRQGFGTIGLMTQFLFFYCSFMAIFYLLYSLLWKRFKNHSYVLYLLHGIALGMSMVSILLQNQEVDFVMNVVLLIIVLYVIYHSRSQGKKTHHLYMIYVLLAIFWVLNIIDILIPQFLQGYQLIIYFASLFIFLLILYRVMRHVGTE